MRKIEHVSGPCSAQIRSFLNYTLRGRQTCLFFSLLMKIRSIKVPRRDKQPLDDGVELVVKSRRKRRSESPAGARNEPAIRLKFFR